VKKVFVKICVALILLASTAGAFIYYKAALLEKSSVAQGVYLEDNINRNFKKVSKPQGYKPLSASVNKPIEVSRLAEGHYFIDFGKVAFGTIQLVSLTGEMEIVLGESKNENQSVKSPYTSKTIEKNNIAYYKTKVNIDNELFTLNLPERFRPVAEELPNKMMGVMPFRFAEIIGSKKPIGKDDLNQIMVHYPFDDNASSFESSSKVLNDIWELSKYTIKATSYAGIYVDGNRERKPYEADAYINQLGHYSVDNEYGLARYTQLFLLENPTWPTEWIMHSILMAHLDFLYTGDKDFLEAIYPKLQARTLLTLARDDGLISTYHETQDVKFQESIGLSRERLADIVDWPPSERDDYDSLPVGKREFLQKTIEYEARSWRAALVGLMGFDLASQIYREEATRIAKGRYTMPRINTVVNSFHYISLVRLAEIAGFIGKSDDVARYTKQAEKIKVAIQSKLFDTSKGLFIDGEGATHSSLHANMFPLAFGLVPGEYQNIVVSFIKGKGMACSVYGAQYLLEGLYLAGEEDVAFSLLTSKGERSWAHMIYDLGSTLALESWDESIKPNMDWSHVWGAAPANLISRFVMGVRPLEPGFKTFVVTPNLSSLRFAKSKIPTKYGTIELNIDKVNVNDIVYNINVPAHTTALIYIPKLTAGAFRLTLNDKTISGTEKGKYIYTGEITSGRYRMIAEFS
jgi:hypothetical protein